MEFDSPNRGVLEDIANDPGLPLVWMSASLTQISWSRACLIDSDG